MSNLRNNLSDLGLMINHRTFAKNSVNEEHSLPAREHFGNIANEISNMLVVRVPVTHLWQVEQLQRDLNLKLND